MALRIPPTRGDNIIPSQAAKRSFEVEFFHWSLPGSSIAQLRCFRSCFRNNLRACEQQLGLRIDLPHRYVTELYALAFSILCASGANAFAQGNTATVGDLERLCTAPDNGSKNACRLYILGVSQGMQIGFAIADGLAADGHRACIPENISSATLELTVKTKLGSDLMVYPDDRKLEASGFIGGILVHSFPCGKR
jgi:hypothetical protein